MSEIDYRYEPDSSEEEEKEWIQKLVEKSGFELSSPNLKNSVSWIVLGLILLPFILFSVPQLVGASDAYLVRSGSMEPRIQTGGVVFIYPVDPSKLQKRDVITFRNDFQGDGPDLTTHQIIEKDLEKGDYRFRTQGLANEDPDLGWVMEDEIVGKVGFSIPYLGYVLNWVGTQQFFFTLVMIPALILIMKEFREIGREIRRMKGGGEREKAIQNAVIVISFVIFGLSISFYTGALKRLIQLTGLNPSYQLFGIIAASMMLLTVFVLKFI